MIVVIGLSGLGKPLGAEWVHRPELYSKLVDLPLGETLQSQHLVKGLISFLFQLIMRKGCMLVAGYPVLSSAGTVVQAKRLFLLPG